MGYFDEEDKVACRYAFAGVIVFISGCVAIHWGLGLIAGGALLFLVAIAKWS